MEEDISNFIEKEQKKMDNIVELKSWQSNFRKNSNGSPLANSVFNVELILENDLKLKGKLVFNAFTFEESLTENLNLDSLKIPAGVLDDSFTHALKSYIEKEYRFVPKEQHIQSAVINIARKHSFHPIKSYLEQARSQWDGNPRIETLLHTYLGVEQSEYAFKGLLCLMLGAIQKVYQPKGKFDFVFDFVSGQGAGKTTFLQRLFLEDQDLYTDSISSFKETMEMFAIGLVVLFVEEEPLGYFFMVERMLLGNVGHARTSFTVVSKRIKMIFGHGMIKPKRLHKSWTLITGKMAFHICLPHHIFYFPINQKICTGKSTRRNEKNL